MADENDERFRELVASIAAAYFSNSHVAVSEIPTVMENIAASLRAVVAAQIEPAGAEPSGGTAVATPSAAQIRKSITPEALISFEDGRPYKTLKRHLSVKGLTPAQYREKWGLPTDYPMVSPNYSAARAQMAKTLGLGQLGRQRGGKAPARSGRRGRAAAS